MQTAIKRGGDGFARTRRSGLALVSGREIAVAWCRAAIRDEKSGYICSAAMEWRRAADRFGSTSTMAERCWRQWERLMHLPRRLAEPIGDVSAAFGIRMGSATLDLERPAAELGIHGKIIRFPLAA